MLNEKSPSYPFNLIPNLNRARETRLSNNILAIDTRRSYFNNSFFPSTRILIAKLAILIAKSETHKVSQFFKETVKLYTTLCK